MIRSVLPVKEAEVLVHAFVTSRLDYCNVLWSGLPKKSFYGLQIQNEAAYILTGSSKYEHTTRVLAFLHWFPVQVGADFKVLMLTCKIFNTNAPSYLARLLNLKYMCRHGHCIPWVLIFSVSKGSKRIWLLSWIFRSPHQYYGTVFLQTLDRQVQLRFFKSKLKTHLFTAVYES